MNPEFADTNLFLRYLTNDVPAQADAVERLFRGAARGERALITTPLVIAEMVWTLESFYALPKDEIKEAVLGILNTPVIKVEESGLVLQAAVWYEEKNVDFIDAYHAAWMHARNIDVAHTFDSRHFNRFEHVTTEVPV